MTKRAMHGIEMLGPLWLNMIRMLGRTPLLFKED
jgi:hypothetical protein